MCSAAPLAIRAGPFAQLRFDLELTILGILLIVLIVAGCVAVVRLRRWRYEESAPAALEDQLQSYQTMVERGELAAQEFERIKAHLEQKSAEPQPESGIQAAPQPKASPPDPPDTRIQRPPGEW